MEAQLEDRQSFIKELGDQIDDNITGFNIDETNDGIAIAVKGKKVYAFYTWNYIRSSASSLVARNFLDQYYNRDTRQL